MLETVITYINSFFEVGHAFGLVEQYRKGESVHPAEYCNSGEYKHIDFDKYESLIYHRLIGTVNRAEVEAFGCADAITETYPMRLIVYAPKNCDTDNSYSTINTANEYANDLKAIDLNDIRKAANLVDLKIIIGATNSDGYLVWNQEFDNVSPNKPSANYKVPSTHILAYIDYTIEMIGTASCLATSSNTSYIFKFCGIQDTLQSDPEYCFIDTLA